MADTQDGIPQEARELVAAWSALYSPEGRVALEGQERDDAQQRLEVATGHWQAWKDRLVHRIAAEAGVITGRIRL